MRYTTSMNTKTQVSIGSIFLITLFFSSMSWTKVEYDSNQLRMKNSEEVTKMVSRKIQEATKIQSQQDDDTADDGIHPEPGTLEALKDGLRIALSRPDQDGTRAILFLRLRRELTDLNSLGKVLSDLTTEAIEGVQNKSSSERLQSTYIVLLNNLIAELRPEVSSNSQFKDIVVQIRDAKLEVSKKVTAQERLKIMDKPQSPSKFAEEVVPREKKK
jgi:hypothetical protein